MTASHHNEPLRNRSQLQPASDHSIGRNDFTLICKDEICDFKIEWYNGYDFRPFTKREFLVQLAFSVLIVICTCSFAFASENALFGVIPGSPVTEYGGDNSRYASLITVPNPEPGLQTYFSFQSPEVGICVLKAITGVNKNIGLDDSSGVKAFSIFEKMRLLIEKEYGPSRYFGTPIEKLLEAINAGNSINKLPPLTAAWDIKTEGFKKGSIRSILLTANVIADRSLEDIKRYGGKSKIGYTYVRVQYVFNNYPACSTFKDGSQADVYGVGLQPVEGR